MLFGGTFPLKSFPQRGEGKGQLNFGDYLKNSDDLKNWYALNNEDDLKNENSITNKMNLKDEKDFNMKTSWKT